MVSLPRGRGIEHNRFGGAGQLPVCRARRSREAGEKIVVTRNGRAVACLGPLPERKPIRYGELGGVFLAEDLTIPELVIWDFDSRT